MAVITDAVRPDPVQGSWGNQSTDISAHIYSRSVRYSHCSSIFIDFYLLTLSPFLCVRGCLLIFITLNYYRATCSCGAIVSS